MRKVPRNRYDLSHQKKLSMNFGELVPIYLEEVVPGDSMRVNHEAMVRVAPLASPAYARMKVKIESFYVPKRLCCAEYELHRTGGPDGTDAPVMPYFDQAFLISKPLNFKPGTLWDYMGLPCLPDAIPTVTVAPKVSVMPFRALALIYNQWYAIPDITPEIPVTTTSGAISGAEATAILGNGTNFGPYVRCWERDYFTSLRPNAQRGGAASAPIDIAYTATSKVKYFSGGNATGAASGDASGDFNIAATDARVENIASASVLAESIRLSEKIQLFLEKMSRGGSRYTEFISEIFGRRTLDSRLQRSEFLGGNVGNIQVSEVLSTVQFEGATDDLPQGNMAGHGIHVGKHSGFSYTCPEDGYIISLMSIVPEGGNYGGGYYSGVERIWKRFTRFDEYIPDFAHLGEQPVVVSELTNNFALADGLTLGANFLGYGPRYNEFKTKWGSVHGAFRTSLDFWHLNRGFFPQAGNPGVELNPEFLDILPDDDLNRIFAVEDPDEDHFWVLIHNNVSAVRPIPYSIPGLSNG